jgi:hypothetical protein
MYTLLDLKGNVLNVIDPDLVAENVTIVEVKKHDEDLEHILRKFYRAILTLIRAVI